MYSAWATRKRSKVLVTVSVVSFIAFSAYVIVSMYRPPTCFDSKRNQNELGVDCGGTCSLMCAKQIQPLNVVWASLFEVSQGLWSAFAYVENPNFSAYTENAKYRFTIYDRDNTVLAEVEDSVFISESPILPVFKGRIEMGDKKPYRTEFEWLSFEKWYRVDKSYQVAIEEQKIVNTDLRPEIQAVLVNKEPTPLYDVDVFVIVYDVNKNAVAVSKRYVDVISARGKQLITFSWPNPFPRKIERIQIIPQVPLQEK